MEKCPRLAHLYNQIIESLTTDETVDLPSIPENKLINLYSQILRLLRDNDNCEKFLLRYSERFAEPNNHREIMTVLISRHRELAYRDAMQAIVTKTIGLLANKNQMFMLALHTSLNNELGNNFSLVYVLQDVYENADFPEERHVLAAQALISRISGPRCLYGHRHSVSMIVKHSMYTFPDFAKNRIFSSLMESSRNKNDTRASIIDFLALHLSFSTLDEIPDSLEYTEELLLEQFRYGDASHFRSTCQVVQILFTSRLYPIEEWLSSLMQGLRSLEQCRLDEVTPSALEREDDGWTVLKYLLLQCTDETVDYLRSLIPDLLRPNDVVDQIVGLICVGLVSRDSSYSSLIIDAMRGTYPFTTNSRSRFVACITARKTFEYLSPEKESMVMNQYFETMKDPLLTGTVTNCLLRILEKRRMHNDNKVEQYHYKMCSTVLHMLKQNTGAMFQELCSILTELIDLEGRDKDDSTMATQVLSLFINLLENQKEDQYVVMLSFLIPYIKEPSEECLTRICDIVKGVVSSQKQSTELYLLTSVVAFKSKCDMTLFLQEIDIVNQVLDWLTQGSLGALPIVQYLAASPVNHCILIPKVEQVIDRVLCIYENNRVNDSLMLALCELVNRYRNNMQMYVERILNLSEDYEEMQEYLIAICYLASYEFESVSEFVFNYDIFSLVCLGEYNHRDSDKLVVCLCKIIEYDNDETIVFDSEGFVEFVERNYSDRSNANVELLRIMGRALVKLKVKKGTDIILSCIAMASCSIDRNLLENVKAHQFVDVGIRALI
jgi:hypothetical protein